MICVAPPGLLWLEVWVPVWLSSDVMKSLGQELPWERPYPLQLAHSGWPFTASQVTFHSSYERVIIRKETHWSPHSSLLFLGSHNRHPTIHHIPATRRQQSQWVPFRAAACHLGPELLHESSVLVSYFICILFYFSLRSEAHCWSQSHYNHSVFRSGHMCATSFVLAGNW